MFKNLLITCFLSFSLISIIYPTKKESTKIFDYCYSLEKILSRNLTQKRKNFSRKDKSIYRDIAKFGVRKTRGDFISKMIDQYKSHNSSFIIKLVPNSLFCYAGYWLEMTKPGILESILYTKSKNKMNEFKDLKDDVEEIIDNINSEYKVIKKEFNSFF